MRRSARPELRLEIGSLGVVDPFRLNLVENPSDPGRYLAEDPDRGSRVDLELAGLNLVGASQALLGLSVHWLGQAGRDVDPEDGPPLGEVRIVVKRREARLLASLLRRHLRRLPEPPPWMPDLQQSLEQIDEFLRWEEG